MHSHAYDLPTNLRYQTSKCQSNGNISTAKSWLDRTTVVSDDGLDRSVQARSKQEQPNDHDDGVNYRLDSPAKAPKQVALVHLPIRNRKVDEAKEGVESCSKERQEVPH